MARVRDRLRETYGIPTMAVHERPLDELILTVLSQSTNDRNRDVAFLRLRQRFGDHGPPARPIDYEAMLEAPVADIEEAIRPGGISKVKSARIKAILRAIADTPPPSSAPSGSARSGSVPSGSAPSGSVPSGSAPSGSAPSRSAPSRSVPPGSGAERGGPLSLAWMKDAPIEDSRAYLCELPGVGRKTAACVLLFAYGLPDIPVDTHVSRVGTRLGFFRGGAPFEELHDEMLAITPEGQALELHVNLLRHGRRTCFARNPACKRCPLARMCPSRRLFEG